MANFNSMPALSSSATADSLGLNAAGQPMGIDLFDQNNLDFQLDQIDQIDESLLDGTNGLPNNLFTPSAYGFEDFSTTFEDPFSYTTAARPYDVSTAAVDAGEALNGDGESPNPDELDNKLLSFGVPIQGNATLVDETGQFAEPNMTAELYGMFFVAEDVFGGENTGRPLELTCYRRNLWQCSGQITLPRHVAGCVVTGSDQSGQGIPVPVVELAASITAIESIEGKATEIISIPWKSSNPALGAAEESKVSTSSTAPPNVPLDLSSGQELDGNRVSVPVSWKRLQFKHATANNGRRKGLQQHYLVQINLLAKIGKTNEYVKVAEVQSGPVIVRGRSPRNFDSRKDVPLTGDKRIERKSAEGSSSTPGSGSAVKHQQAHQAAPQHHQQPQQQDLSQNMPRYHSLGNMQQSNNSSEWTTPQPFSPTTNNNAHVNKKLAVSPNPHAHHRPPIPSWSSSGSDSNNNNLRVNSNNQYQPQISPTTHMASSSSKPQRSGGNNAALPISLSLSDDAERGISTSPGSNNPHRSGSSSGDGIGGLHSPSGRPFSGSRTNSSAGEGGFRGGAGGFSGGSQQNYSLQSQQQLSGSGGSPLEAADMLYEYFPLSLDDWMPPVDAVYRPHVVHHTIVPPEVKAQQTRSKTKRYFAAE